MPTGERIARLEFSSALAMLDLVEIVSDHVSRRIGCDEDTRHAVGLALRESVINAVKHGNRNDAAKHVVVEFAKDASALIVRVRDQGEGFEPSAIADPLAPENLLNSSGRGIFLIRSFMDDVRMARLAEGGMEISMTKHF